MNKSLEVLKSIYKPYKYTIKGKATVLETTSGDFVIKEKNKDINELYNYLISRNFNNFPKIIDSSRKDVNVYEYLTSTKMPDEQKCDDLIDLISNLHNRTCYFKEVSEDKYKSIYEDILQNISYLKNYYNVKYEMYFSEIYMSPSHYLLMRNFSKIESALEFCEKELDSWYSLVKEETKIRVSVVHNNLELDHFIKSDQDYLISWDDYLIETPVLDIVKLYKKEYERLNFEEALQRYFNNFPLLEHEKKLLFILIALPPTLENAKTEFDLCKEIRKKFDYVFKTEKVLRPYYSEDEVVE
ncbi:MAG: hypothetical protein RSF02_02740 [Bacilli bacterium]